MNEHPTMCNLCGGKVEYISNALIYGRQYGSGFAYRCKACGAYVGTHKDSDRAMGILADREMRDMKMKCHRLFDAEWLDKANKHKARNEAYKRLAKNLGIPHKECHFGWFNTEMLNKAYRILSADVEEV